MDIAFSAEEEAFRQEVRDFLAENLSDHLKREALHGFHMQKEDLRAWHKLLHRRGWSAPNWPQEYGGTGWDAVKQYIFEEECMAAGAPMLLPFGINMVGPVIQAFGSDAQKARYLPKIVSGDEFWCQGYSEPGSGSDLASLKTRAVRDGDHYVVNGQKIWTTQAHMADMMFCLVRTDPNVKAQEGISFLLIDMTTPGITVRPIISIDEDHSLNEVFFEDVRVPAANLIGQENKGWTYAKFLLGHERTSIAEVGLSKQRIRRLKEIAKAEACDGGSLLDDDGFRRKIAEVEVTLMGLEMTNLRVLSSLAQGSSPGAEASMLKIRGSEVKQRIAELTCEALGYYVNPYEDLLEGSNAPHPGPDYAEMVASEMLIGRAASIYGGSNEIQRNVIAKMVLGL
ncbi:acyl-CoA dehydrogenase family protein [Marinibaculum pumilum]|uniref:Acyl-CoA dehydrogenase family protein n=1 Tax=Marinibaculum pumilum TaxID=1766165 RepID=A0ABV7L906_9PROT